MSYVQESRAGEPHTLHLGGNYAQPAASEHATPEGQSLRHMGWSGDRNSGQPIYEDLSKPGITSDTEDRYRKLVGESWDRFRREVHSLGSTLVKSRSPDEAARRYFQQLLSMSFSD